MTKNNKIKKYEIKDSEKIYYQKLKEQLCEADIEVYNMIIRDINAIGFNIEFIQEIKFLSKKELHIITPIIIKYDNMFLDVKTNNELILLLGRKGCCYFTNYLIAEFNKPNIYYKEGVFNYSRRWAISNAIIKIKDKTKIQEYINLVKNNLNSEDIILLIILISKWKVNEFIPLLVKLLESNSYEIRVASVDALVRYNKVELWNHIKLLENDENTYVQKSVLNAKKKLLS